MTDNGNIQKIKAYWDGTMSEADALAFQFWLSEHGDEPEVGTVLEALFEPVGPDPEAREAFARLGARLGLESGKGRKRTLLTAVVSALCTAGVLSSLFLWGTSRHSGWNETAVPKGETAVLTLADGSRLTLNAGTRVTYPRRFSGRVREIFLDGQVLADITADKKHPFIIHAGGMDLQVFGTRFEFKGYADSDVAEVLLLDGSVSLEIKEDGQSRILEMAPGDMVAYDRAEREAKVTRFDKARYRSFEDRAAIRFFNTPIGDIAADLSRLFGCRIVIEGENLARQRIFAYFANGEDLDDILSVMKRDNPSLTVRCQDGIIILSENS